MMTEAAAVPFDPLDPVARLVRVARDHSDAPAVIERDGITDYGAFLMMVKRLAGAIVGAGGEHPRVLVALPQGCAAYASMFAALYCGGEYAPLNVSSPVSRQQMVIAQYDAAIIITNQALCGQLELGDGAAQILLVEEIDRFAVLDQPGPAAELAYTIFTSGSTGRPKGVMIPRSALRHYLQWAIPALGLGVGERCSQHPNIGFDLSVLDIFATLCSGAALVPVATRKDRMLPAEVVRDFALTVWVSVPSVVDLMRKTNGLVHDNLKSLKLLFFCGEPLMPAHLEAIFSALPAVEVINAYGPTEATVSCTQTRLTKANYKSACSDTVALGSAIAEMDVDLVGGPDGDEGEIVISGPQLALGYANADAQQALAFRDKGPGQARAYFTGDWARRVKNELYFVSRIDRQVKINGHRLELGEVDCALRDAGAIMSHTALHNGRLVCFVTLPQGRSLDEIRAAVRLELPDYALPRDIRVMDQLPLSPNDKIDVTTLERMLDDESA